MWELRNPTAHLQGCPARLTPGGLLCGGVSVAVTTLNTKAASSTKAPVCILSGKGRDRPQREGARLPKIATCLYLKHLRKSMEAGMGFPREVRSIQSLAGLVPGPYQDLQRPHWDWIWCCSHTKHWAPTSVLPRGRQEAIGEDKP